MYVFTFNLRISINKVAINYRPTRIYTCFVKMQNLQQSMNTVQPIDVIVNFPTRVQAYENISIVSTLKTCTLTIIMNNEQVLNDS